jgi:hypothetical protein
MIKDKIIKKLSKLTKHKNIEIVERGNSAIDSALSILPKSLLIPEEGGWIHYQKAPKHAGLKFEYVKCKDAKIDLDDLKSKLSTGNYSALLYHQPGGYFAKQDMKKIYHLCQEYDCLVIMDVSGSVGTKLCNGDYANIIIGSFGKWKLVPAEVGGFISTDNPPIWHELTRNLKILKDEEKLELIYQKLLELPKRINFLEEKVNKVINDLSQYEILNDKSFASVVMVKYKNDEEKKEVIDYCKENKLDYVLCPKYIRLQQKAISIEIKRLY